MGRHLGVFSCTLLIVGRIIGTGIFRYVFVSWNIPSNMRLTRFPASSTPSSILGSVGSVGASLMLWVLGFVLSACGLFVWLEFGTMFPRSGGEKVYLEAVYKKPKYLATVIFASNAILLGFTASGCIVSILPYLLPNYQCWRSWHRYLQATFLFRLDIQRTDGLSVESLLEWSFSSPSFTA